MSEATEPRPCPSCGRGELVDITYREGSEEGGEQVQRPEARQVETYSCGHEVVGPRLERSAAGTDELEVERREPDETVEPPAEGR